MTLLEGVRYSLVKGTSYRLPSLPGPAPSLLLSILKSNFSGASGPVQFGKELEKGRNYEGITVGVYNIRPRAVNPDTGKRTHDAFMISIWREGVGWEDIPGQELIYRDGTTISGLYRRIYEWNFITPRARAIGLGLMFFAWILAAVAMILLGWLRNDPIVRRSQPVFMQTLCVGSIITSTSIFTTSFDEDAACWSNHQLSILCSLTPWFFFTGNILIFCSLFIKLWRVDRVIRCHQTAISLLKALWPLLGFLVITLSILSAHTVYDPWSWERHIIKEIPAETYGKCQSNDSMAFFAPLGGILFAAEAVTLYFAWRTADVPSDFRDSQAIMYTCLTQIQAWCIGIPMLVLIGYSSADASYFARIFLIWIFTVSGVVLVAWPKIIKAIKIRRNPHIQSINGRRSTISGVLHSRDFNNPADSLGEMTLGDMMSPTEIQNHQSKFWASVMDQIQDEYSSSEESTTDPPPSLAPQSKVLSRTLSRTQMLDNDSAAEPETAKYEVADLIGQTLESSTYRNKKGYTLKFH